MAEGLSLDSCDFSTILYTGALRASHESMSISLAILVARELNIRIHIMQLSLHFALNIAFSLCVTLTVYCVLFWTAQIS